MKAYKGFTKELTSVLGDGKKENCTFEIGVTKKVERSKTMNSGFHCCENPFDCLKHYAYGNGNRFFIVEAAGDIDEAEDEKIACTEITLLKELELEDFAGSGMLYMMRHPDRRDWEKNFSNVKVGSEEVELGQLGKIGIARGVNPRVKAPAGAAVGLIKETDGEMQYVGLYVVSESDGNKWHSLNGEGGLVVEESND